MSSDRKHSLFLAGTLPGRFPLPLSAIFFTLSACMVPAQVLKYAGAQPAVDFGDVNVCLAGKRTPAPCDKTMTLKYTVTTGGVLGTPNVLTLGVAGLDFASVAGTTCTGTVATGSSCVVKVELTPRVAGARNGAVQITDAGGSALETTFIYGNGVGPQIAFGPGTRQVVYFDDGGMESNIDFLEGVAVDGAGDIFLATDGGREWESEFGVIEKFTANGEPPTDIPVLLPDRQSLVSPTSLTIDGAGNLFVYDSEVGIIKVPPGGGNATILSSTVGGNLGMDGAGDLFVLGAMVTKFPADGGTPVIVPVMDSGYRGVAVDSAGNLYTYSSATETLLKQPAVGGASSLIAENIKFDSIALDGAGNFYLLVPPRPYTGPPPAPLPSQCMVEIPAAGGGTRNSLGCYPANYTGGIAIDASGSPIVSYNEMDNFDDATLMKFERSQPPTLHFASTATGASSKSQTVAIDNVGNTTLVLSGLTVDPEFAQVAGKGTHKECAGDLLILAGKACNLSIEFEPVTEGKLKGSVHIEHNSLNSRGSSQAIPLSGTGVRREDHDFTAAPIK